MEREKLIDEIIDFYIMYGIIKPCQIEEVKARTKIGLQKCEFIEGLINLIIRRTKDNMKLDTEKIIRLLNALDRVRLELEYYDK